MAGEDTPRGQVPQRITVVLDYAFLYYGAREAFSSPPGAVPPAWFGNFPPEGLAHAAIVSPPPWHRRSERRLAQVRVVVPEIAPGSSVRAIERVEEWKRRGILVREAPRLPAPSWRIARAVLLAVEVLDAVRGGECETVVLGAGEPGLLPLLRTLMGGRREESQVELMTWVTPSGVVLSPLAMAAPHVWCHRFGAPTFARLAARATQVGSPAQKARPRADSEDLQALPPEGGAAVPADRHEGEPHPVSLDRAVRTWPRWLRKGRRGTQ